MSDFLLIQMSFLVTVDGH